MNRVPVTLTTDRLVYMLFLATLFHGVLIMGVSFRGATAAGTAARPLEVVLVGQRSDDPAPERARYVADHAQRGEGQTQEDAKLGGIAATGDAADNPGELTGQGLDTVRKGQVHQQQEVLVSPADALRQARAALNPSPRPERATMQARLMVAGASNPNLTEDEHSPGGGEGNRQRVVSVDTQEAQFAGYLAAWKQRVEQLGTLNFPDAARRVGLSGNPVLEVAIGADGGLREIIVLRSSQHKLLDQAALRILRLAAPFEPFPPNIRRDYDVLRFVYEWRFIGDQGALHAQSR